ncbi:response regulator transcription factor [Nitrincola alkalisediminis]|uniref:response regulator transcription factor n=1 Tax=Nitrincola alkalisediminis TaxID=1366656 RepID=UPI001874F3CB|nr:response regulator transcription factor [Nitrincola alkalisediminis]
MQGKRILLLEDDHHLTDIVSEFLQNYGYEVTVTHTGKAFSDQLVSAQFDLIIMDLNLPDADGVELLCSMRQHHNMLVFIVSGRQGSTVRLDCFEKGADAYITKPFSLLELELQVRNALVRQDRYAQSDASSPQDAKAIHQYPLFDGWYVCTKTQSVQHNQDGEMSLTQGEYQLLLFLLRANGSVVTRDQIIEGLSESARLTCVESVNALIYRIRKKFIKHCGISPLVTVSGAGYRVGQKERS